MPTVQITDTRLIRDIHSKAVLNTDRTGLDEYIMKKELARKGEQEKSETKQKLTQLENDMAEIKKMLQDIAELRKV
jgi:t-SNARE complex subunit (syntaxin)